MVKLGDLLKDQASLNQLDNFMIMTASLCVITILKNYTYQIASSLRHKVSLASSHKPNNYNKKTHPHTCSITTNWSVVNMENFNLCCTMRQEQVQVHHCRVFGFWDACWHHITLSHWRHLSCAETYQTLSAYLSIFSGTVIIRKTHLWALMRI